MIFKLEILKWRYNSILGLNSWRVGYLYMDKTQLHWILFRVFELSTVACGYTSIQQDILLNTVSYANTTVSAKAFVIQFFLIGYLTLALKCGLLAKNTPFSLFTYSISGIDYHAKVVAPKLLFTLAAVFFTLFNDLNFFYTIPELFKFKFQIHF